MSIITLIIVAGALILGGYACYRIKQQKKIDIEIEQKNKKILENYNELQIKEKNLINKLKLLEEQEYKATEKLKELANTNENAATAFEQYVAALEQAYNQKEKEFENNIQLLDNSYAIAQKSWIDKQTEVLSDLDRIKNTRAAAMEAQLKEQEIKAQKEYYSINISALELNDVKILRDIEYKLNNPRVLRMLIWQNFFREPMNQLCNNIIGVKTKSGIYKITNQLTNMCYIGQAVDLAKRWKDHAKCGLGIDTPVNNKLYKAMQLNGLENFTWEILEECPSNELNEKEKFYIELYQADKFGYNAKGGNK